MTCRLFLRLLQGRLTLLLGPPGAGKSVLLQTLAGQLRPSSRVRVRPREPLQLRLRTETCRLPCLWWFALAFQRVGHAAILHPMLRPLTKT